MVVATDRRLKFKNPNGITFDVAEGERPRVSR